jgi:serine phosphatase RsbU (regulator of sigma subunit)
VEQLALGLSATGQEAVTTSWLSLPERNPHVCILLSPPDGQVERAVLASLSGRRLPLFATGDPSTYQSGVDHSVFRLPCELEVTALSSFLALFPPTGEGGPDPSRTQNMTRELRLASELQRSILPREVPSGLPVNLARKYVPFQYIGGDLYDFIALDGERLGLVIADACGHGICAAFMTAMFKSAFRLFALEGGSPARTMARLNTEFARTLMSDQFMSAFYLILDTSSGRATYCSAGHPPQLLFRATGEVDELSSMGFILGSVEAARYMDGETSLGQGDRLLLYTDGLVETADASGNQFGRAGVCDVVRRNFHRDLEEISNELLSEAVMFLHQPTFEDDVTFILAELTQEL